MKRIFTLGIILCAALWSFGQVDTTGKEKPSEKSDTIRVGGMIIVRKPGGDNEIYKTHKDKEPSHYHYHYHDYGRSANISTNWAIFDFGFSNYTDNTKYPPLDIAPDIKTNDAFKLNTWKSRNINLWLFMQKLNVVKHVVNLKYGFGVELNNYFFEDKRLHMTENPTIIFLDTAFATLHKNKLAADYFTVPLMININFTPNRGRGFGISAGVSAGYLYSSRQKIKGNGEKFKIHDDFDLERWKISYIGELILGPIKLYGSYATKSMWQHGLDITPYTIGIRLSNW